MNISSLQSSSANLITQDFRAKFQGTGAAEKFRHHRPMPSQIANGKDHGSPMPPTQASRFKGPLPAQSLPPTMGLFKSNDPGPTQDASAVAPGAPANETSLPNMGLFNSSDPLPSMGLFNSNDPVGGRDRGPMPRQLTGFAAVAASAVSVGAAVPQMDFSA